MEATLYTIVGAITTTLFTELAKRFKIPTEYAVFICSALLAVGYILSLRIIGEEALWRFFDVALQTATLAVTIYEFILKRLWKKA